MTELVFYNFVYTILINNEYRQLMDRNSRTTPFF
ncbi:protein of unknown function [Mesotoga infera]|uniref:Uncharacterized protein n=1 Tax=Mesotoga infera TaxID=1236046 RepID=A0A7Z7LEB7_9BACT|nr:protein of unknown function [Mesotoga infera]